MTAIEGMRTQEVLLNIQVILNGAAEHSLPDHYRWEQCTAIKDQFKKKISQPFMQPGRNWRILSTMVPSGMGLYNSKIYFDWCLLCTTKRRILLDLYILAYILNANTQKYLLIYCIWWTLGINWSPVALCSHHLNSPITLSY